MLSVMYMAEQFITYQDLILVVTNRRCKVANCKQKNFSASVRKHIIFYIINITN